MSRITIRFSHNAGDQDNSETVIYDIDPYNSTCRDIIRKFCEKSRSPFVVDTDKLCFTFNGKILNGKQFLDLNLSDKKIKLIKDNHEIMVKDLEHLIGQI